MQTVSNIPAQLGARERNVVDGQDSRVVIMSNILEVITQTGADIDAVKGIGAYDGRGMWFLLPSENGEIVFIMDQMINFPAEVDLIRDLLDKAGIGREKLIIKVLTPSGFSDYSSGLLKNSFDDLSPEMKLYFLHYLLSNSGSETYPNENYINAPLHLMMNTGKSFGVKSDILQETEINLTGRNTEGMDKAVVRAILETSGNGETLSSGTIIFNSFRYNEALKRFPQIAENNYLLIEAREDNVEENLDFLIDQIKYALNEYGFVVVKYGAGYSGEGNFFIRDELTEDLEVALRKFLTVALDPKVQENIVIEKGYNLIRDEDGHVEYGARGYIKKDGSVVTTSVHRQQTTSGGIYEGVILANKGENLSTNPTAQIAFNEVHRKFYEMLDVYRRFGYFGVINIDFIVDDVGNVKAVDLNNLREGGSTASSNISALLTQAIENGNGININSSLGNIEDVNPSELGLWDRDYILVGDLQGEGGAPNLNVFDEVLQALIAEGLYPYSTSTLHLASLNGDITRKLKLAVPFDFSRLTELEDETRFEHINRAILRIANGVLNKYGLSLQNPH